MVRRVCLHVTTTYATRLYRRESLDRCRHWVLADAAGRRISANWPRAEAPRGVRLPRLTMAPSGSGVQACGARFPRIPSPLGGARPADTRRGGLGPVHAREAPTLSPAVRPCLAARRGPRWGGRSR